MERRSCWVRGVSKNSRLQTSKGPGKHIKDWTLDHPKSGGTFIGE